jgi:hypothetical protein
MSLGLDAYKRSLISQLTNAFNTQLNALQKQLNANISYINSLRINNRLKTNSINAFIASYNSAVAKLRAKLAADIKAVNLLTAVPGSNANASNANASNANASNAKKNALLIGINYRGTTNELNGCINDTKNVSTLLQERFNYNCVFLTDDSAKKPTKQNIINELTNLLAQSASGDSLFFLYSGHGTCTSDINGDELDRQDELIVPIDATSIRSCILDDELNQIIRNGLKPGVKLFALFDSCFSGTVLDLRYNYLDNSNRLSTTINMNVPETNGQVIMISGCMDSQTSADAYVNYGGKNMASGAMTFAFLKTIEQQGTNISLKTLIDSMRSFLKNNEYDQIPQLSCGQATNIETTLLQM